MIMENGWTETDAWGDRSFHHDGWVIHVRDHGKRIWIDTPYNDAEVAVDADGIGCFGERHTGGYGGFEGVRFTIPWPIAHELCKLFP
jgi:hypothetical protein